MNGEAPRRRLIPEGCGRRLTSGYTGCYGMISTGKPTSTRIWKRSTHSITVRNVGGGYAWNASVHSRRTSRMFVTTVHQIKGGKSGCLLKKNGGKLTLGSSSSTFVSKTNQKSFQLAIGKNNRTGESGVIGIRFETTMVKRPVREYLTRCGWKKAGLFG